jgi:hypothetical protein
MSPTPTVAQMERLYETLRKYTSEKRFLTRLTRGLERDRHSTLPSGYDYLTDEAAIRRTLGEYPRDRYREGCRRAVKALDTAVISLLELESALQFLELKGEDKPPCSVESCDKLQYTKGVCRVHYTQPRDSGIDTRVR